VASLLSVEEPPEQGENEGEERAADGDQKRLRGSIEHTSAQQLKARSSEHHSLERFEPIHLPFNHSLTPFAYEQLMG
jgi:hypothetical protein